jgi:hypothetical protein
VKASGGLQRLQFEGGLFGSRFFTRLEVPADADTVQLADDPPRRDAIPVFKPADGKCSVVAYA